MSSTLKAFSFLGSKAIKEKLLEFKTSLNNTNASLNEMVTEDVINIGSKTQNNFRLSTTLQHAPMPTDKISRVEQEKALPKCLPFEPGFEKLHSIPTKLSKRQTKKLRQLEKSKTKGKGWFDMPVQEMTEEKINDLKIIQMRGALDPKHFYKKTDSRPGVLPKFFQTGSVVETSADFYSDRLPKKQRKKTLVDELLNDAEFKSFKKRKYAEVMAKTFSKKKKRAN